MTSNTTTIRIEWPVWAPQEITIPTASVLGFALGAFWCAAATNDEASNSEKAEAVTNATASVATAGRGEAYGVTITTTPNRR
jgi:hypothetical protein